MCECIYISSGEIYLTLLGWFVANRHLVSFRVRLTYSHGEEGRDSGACVEFIELWRCLCLSERDSLCLTVV